MNIKRTIVSTVAALGLAASVMTSAALAQPPTDSNPGNDTTNVYVSVQNTGTFDAFFTASFNLSTTQVNAGTGGTATGSFTIQYTDTLVDRGAFQVNVSATDFTDGTNTIDASGFHVTHTYNVGQYQWDGHNIEDGHNHGFGNVNPPKPVVAGDIGDIGYCVNGVIDQSQQAGGEGWTAGVTNLETGGCVNHGYAGIGTNISQGNVDVALTIPAGTVAGSYQSQITLTIAPVGP